MLKAENELLDYAPARALNFDFCGGTVQLSALRDHQYQKWLIGLDVTFTDYEAMRFFESMWLLADFRPTGTRRNPLANHVQWRLGEVTDEDYVSGFWWRRDDIQAAHENLRAIATNWEAQPAYPKHGVA